MNNLLRFHTENTAKIEHRVASRSERSHVIEQQSTYLINTSTVDNNYITCESFAGMCFILSCHNTGKITAKNWKKMVIFGVYFVV